MKRSTIFVLLLLMSAIVLQGCFKTCIVSIARDDQEICGNEGFVGKKEKASVEKQTKQEVKYRRILEVDVSGFLDNTEKDKFRPNPDKEITGNAGYVVGCKKG